jgi:hypothetical protein
MSDSHDSPPARRPVVVRAGDLEALADRLEERAASGAGTSDASARDLVTAARLARHAARVWVGRSAVSLP